MARSERPGRVHEAAPRHGTPAQSPLDRLVEARGAREAAEDAEREAVRLAREAGLSWTKIGAVYGLTKQGAQQRFKAPIQAPTAAD